MLSWLSVVNRGFAPLDGYSDTCIKIQILEYWPRTQCRADVEARNISGVEPG
jgi:hypothetical protein